MIGALLLLAGGQIATAPHGAAPAPSAAPAPADMAAVLRQQGMSPAGIAAFQRTEPGARVATQAFMTQGRSLELESQAAARAGDVERLARALHARDALVARFTGTRTDTTLNLLRALSPADRQVMLRGLAGGRR